MSRGREREEGWREGDSLFFSGSIFSSVQAPAMLSLWTPSLQLCGYRRQTGTSQRHQVGRPQ